MLTYSDLTEDSITIFFESDLPINGWLQSCIFCESYTSKLKCLENYKNYKINFHVCKECNNKITLKKNKYLKILNYFKNIINNIKWYT